MPSADHTLVLRAEDVNHAKQHDLDDKGIAKTAREEKLRARDAKAKDAEMMKLYRQHVLKEEPLEGFVPLAGIAPAPAPAKKAEAEEVGTFGD
jgi:7,8-dihydro-6-hydroxymethylpterin dimethyltransferase